MHRKWYAGIHQFPTVALFTLSILACAGCNSQGAPGATPNAAIGTAPLPPEAAVVPYWRCEPHTLSFPQPHFRPLLPPPQAMPKPPLVPVVPRLFPFPLPDFSRIRPVPSRGIPPVPMPMYTPRTHDPMPIFAGLPNERPVPMPALDGAHWIRKPLGAVFLKDCEGLGKPEVQAPWLKGK